MTWWEALVLGVVQGATEFLPVSSSGHLVVGQTLLGIEIPGAFFEIVVHVGTLVSILVVYRVRILVLLASAFRREREAWSYIGLLGLASVPAGAIGLFFRDTVESVFDAPWVAGVALLVTGFLLITTRAAMSRPEGEWRSPGWRAALVMGLAQACALVPGISRSGSTVVAGLWLGVDPDEAAAFSFLMAVVAIGGAALLSIPELAHIDPGLGTVVLVVAGVGAAVTGVLAIRTFVLMLRRRSFHAFAWYVWAVGAAFLLWLGLR